MKTFAIRLSQNLYGHYKGTLTIEAVNLETAERILNSMTNEELDDKTLWGHGDEYEGDIDSITFESDLEEI